MGPGLTAEKIIGNLSQNNPILLKSTVEPHH